MRTQQSPPRREEGKALRFLRRRAKFFVVRLSVCALLGACLFGARYVNPKSVAMVNKYLTYTVDFTQPVESVMGYFDVKPQTIVTPPAASPAPDGAPAQNPEDGQEAAQEQQTPPPDGQSPEAASQGQENQA